MADWRSGDATPDYSCRQPWPEDIGAGYTEMEVSNRPRSRIGVVWPLDAGINSSQQYCNTFAHIGSVKAG